MVIFSFKFFREKWEHFLLRPGGYHKFYTVKRIGYIIPTLGNFEVTRIKEARGSFFGRGVEVLKLQSRIEDQLRSPSYYIMISI